MILCNFQLISFKEVYIKTFFFFKISQKFSACNTTHTKFWKAMHIDAYLFVYVINA